MTSRTCPNCGHKYSITKYYKKFLFKLLDSQWDCENCGSRLTFKVGRRTLVALVSMIPLGFGYTLTSSFQDILNFPKILSYLFFLLLFFIWVLFVYRYDAFEVIKKKD